MTDTQPLQPAPRTFAEAAEQLREAAGKHPKNRKREEYGTVGAGYLKKFADMLDLWTTELQDVPVVEYVEIAKPGDWANPPAGSIAEAINEITADEQPAEHVHTWTPPAFPGGYHTCTCSPNNTAVGAPNQAVAGWPIEEIKTVLSATEKTALRTVMGMDGTLIPALPLPSDSLSPDSKIDHERLALRRFAKESGALELFSLPPMLDESRYMEDANPKA